MVKLRIVWCNLKSLCLKSQTIGKKMSIWTYRFEKAPLWAAASLFQADIFGLHLRTKGRVHVRLHVFVSSHIFSGLIEDEYDFRCWRSFKTFENAFSSGFGLHVGHRRTAFVSLAFCSGSLTSSFTCHLLLFPRTPSLPQSHDTGCVIVGTHTRTHTFNAAEYKARRTEIEMKGGDRMWAEEEEEEKEGVWEHHRGDVTSRPPSQHPSLPYSHHTHTHTLRQQSQHLTGAYRNATEMTSCDSTETWRLFSRREEAVRRYICVCVGEPLRLQRRLWTGTISGSPPLSAGEAERG